MRLGIMYIIDKNTAYNNWNVFTLRLNRCRINWINRRIYLHLRVDVTIYCVI